LLEKVVLELKRRRYLDGVSKLFVYTKPDVALQLEPLGFYEVAIAYPDVVFMESEQGGFDRYLESLTPIGGNKIGAIIMNANPFTKGHLYLVETALAAVDVLHLFVVSEDRSFFPYQTRKMLVQQGTQHLKNIYIHDTVDQVASAEAKLDAAIFSKVARRLSITRRFVGDEPLSPTTNLYNQALLASLPKKGVEVTVIPRLEAGDAPISASRVRKAIMDGEIESLSGLLPETTYQYLLSPEGQALIAQKQ
jgi:[citrate (pro-3S)-lyase] ligase